VSVGSLTSSCGSGTIRLRDGRRVWRLGLAPHQLADCGALTTDGSTTGAVGKPRVGGVSLRGLACEVPPSGTSNNPVVLDLFCGAGGMSLGFERAGYRIGLGVDRDPQACETHAYNFGNRSVQADLAEIGDPEGFVRRHGVQRVDVIVAGPPCQGFSRVGRGKLRDLKKDAGYIHDPRNQCYKDFIRFVDGLKPAYFVLENVPDMAFYSDGEGSLVDKMLNALAELGYCGGHDGRPAWGILSAEDYGVPQTRRRLFIAGSNRDREIDWPPEPTHRGSPVTVWDAIGDLPIIAHGCRIDEMPYEARDDLSDYQQIMRDGAGYVLFNHQTRWHNQQDLHAFAWMPEGWKYVDLPERFKRYRDDIFKDKYRKLYRDRPSWTIEAHIGKDTYRHIYPAGLGDPEPPRTISVREAARLQSFPDRFRFRGAFTKQFCQVGNAVPPLLAKAVAAAIRRGVVAGLAESLSPEQDPEAVAGGRMSKWGLEH